MAIYNLFRTANCSIETPYITSKGLRDQLEKETGRDRLIRMYSKTYMNEISPELRYCLQSSTYVACLAGFYGGMKAMRLTRADYIRKNVASTYESQHLARRHLTDSMTLSAVGGACRHFFQYGSFCAIYLLATMSAANYRNEIWALDHSLTAAVLGGCSRIMYGPKGFLAAAFLGGTLGLMSGGILKLTMKASGVTMDDFRLYQHEMYYTQYMKKKVEVND